MASLECGNIDACTGSTCVKFAIIHKFVAAGKQTIDNPSWFCHFPQ